MDRSILIQRPIILRSALLLLAFAIPAFPSLAQTCTTQARMTPEIRDSLANAALAFAQSVKSNNGSAIMAAAAPDLAANFGPTAFLIRTTSEKLAGATLEPTQLYMLEAKAGAAAGSEGDFSCQLSGTTSETDFAIPNLPAGTYGFTMVEASGPQPWLLAAIFRQDGSAWKLAGFYPHPREAAGHDGRWYWNAALKAAGSKDLWLAWLYYGEADQLLRPSSFVSSTNLDKLRSDARAATPPELSDGLGVSTPLVVKGAPGTQYDFTSISAQGSEDGKRLNLMLHLRADPIDDAAAARARNQAAARAFLTAHKDLREIFNGVWVFAESPGQEPFTTEQPMSAIPQ